MLLHAVLVHAVLLHAVLLHAVLLHAVLQAVNISQFYPRPNTPAAAMKQLNSQIVKRRSREATQLFEAYTCYDWMVGTVQKVTVLILLGLHACKHACMHAIVRRGMHAYMQQPHKPVCRACVGCLYTPQAIELAGGF